MKMKQALKYEQLSNEPKQSPPPAKAKPGAKPSPLVGPGKDVLSGPWANFLGAKMAQFGL